MTASVPPVPAVVAHARGAIWLTPDGEIETLDRDTAARRLSRERVLVCHALATAARLGLSRLDGFDLLDLFAFVRPARFCLPTPRGLARALGLPEPADHEDEAMVLPQAALTLLRELTRLPADAAREAHRMGTLAATMARAGWPWGTAVLAALGDAGASGGRFGGLDVWTHLPEWSDHADPPPPDHQPVSAAEARDRLRQLLGSGAESRPSQFAYTELAAEAFLPRDRIDQPHLVLAEAGTGIGKTLGYIAPASLWAAKNGGAVWLSTYTKNLQRQIDGELDRLIPDPVEKSNRVVVRKGRENYFCLLNFEEAAQGGAAQARDLVALGLMARWASKSRDGDMVGGDFPSWISELHGRARTLALTDRRGECVYAACPHYRKCFIERSLRKARRAEIVIANHALAIHQAARADDTAMLPLRYVFDEAHHVFDAADDAFSAEVSGREGMELRRWLRGPEENRRSRARGLEKRIGDLVAGSEASIAAMQAAIHAALALPADGYHARIAEGNPLGPGERFLHLVRAQTLARAREPDSNWGIECPAQPPVPGLVEAAAAYADALTTLAQPLNALVKNLTKMLSEEAETLDTATRARIEGIARGIARRAETVTAWKGMLNDIAKGTPEAFADWFALDRDDGREADVAFRRHWIDPTLPFAKVVLEPAHGALLTSATLRDQDTPEDDGWSMATARTGAQHLILPARRASLASPFDYGGRTQVLIVTDVKRDDPDQVAAAFRSLFQASGGGALGLFTAIWRLRMVHKRIAAALDATGLDLYAQHVDPLDISTLIDIFRAETDSCLLGTDAVRDGVDVPGRALRLIVFDRVPWPRPDILHKARRDRFGRDRYDDMLTRLKLKQAYGRLLRRADDRGVFVLLDAQTPSRLLSAFPSEVAVARVGLAEAVARTRAFLTETDERERREQRPES